MKLIFQSATTLTTRFGAAVIVFAMSALAARQLSLGDFGLFTAALGLATTLSKGAQAGLNQFALKRLSVLFALKQFLLFNYVVRWSTIVVSLLSVILGVIIGVIFFRSMYAGAFEVWDLVSFVVWVHSTSICLYLSHVLRASDLPLMSGVVGGLASPFLVAISMILWPLNGFSDLMARMAGFGMVVTFIACCVLIKQRDPSQAVKFETVGVKWKELGSFWVSNTVTHLLSTLPLLVLTFKGSAEEIGLFGIAMRVLSVSLIFNQALNIAIVPSISRAFESHEMVKVESILRSYALLSTMYSGIILFIFIVGWNQIANNIFGSEYVMAKNLVLILIFGALVNAFGGSSGYALMMSGYAGRVMKNNILSLMFTLIVAFVSIEHYGGFGAALTYLFSQIFLNGINSWCSWRLLGIITFSSFSPIGALKSLKAL